MRRGGALKVPPEVDALMWTVVEQGSEKAVDEFKTRYPQYIAEVDRRVTMLAGLKKMKPGPTLNLAAEPPPPFRPKEAPRPMPMGRPVWIAAALVLAALGVASFTVGYLLLPERKPAPAPTQPSVGGSEEPPIKAFEPDEIVPKRQDPPKPSLSAEDVPPERTTPPSKKTVTLRLLDVPLHTALEALQAEAGVKIIAAPGLPNPKVEVGATDQTILDVLSEMGERYGFTAFDQGDGSIVVVPGTDENNPPNGSTGPTSARDTRRIGG